MKHPYMGLDVGDARIGIAISDPTATIAQPYDVLHRQGKWQDVMALRQMIEELGVTHVIVGNPKHLNNLESAQAKKVLRFTNALKHDYPLDITFVDERLTSVSAHDLLLASGVKRKDHRPIVDKIAAAEILQLYLDSRK